MLIWFLQRWNLPAEVAEALVDEAIGGRFHSWTSPETVLVDDVAERLALSLRQDVTTRSLERGGRDEPAPDHLERWLAVRGCVRWKTSRLPAAGTTRWSRRVTVW
ncbi:hypothetical protein [Nonomuraea antri]|uniref:hypothetical protein n=1 Tax=Nonomuraea antri TaxID=2730852 RepID=UPI001C2B77D8|nr:hypothetical protein [Nonomuraea antri]